jgi:hypothetical protein
MKTEVFTGARHWSLSWARLIQSVAPSDFSNILSSVILLSTSRSCVWGSSRISLEVLSWICMERLRRITKNLSHDWRWPGRKVVFFEILEDETFQQLRNPKCTPSSEPFKNCIAVSLFHAFYVSCQFLFYLNLFNSRRVWWSAQIVKPLGM